MSEGVASAQQENRGAAAEESMVTPREATDGQQVEDSEQAIEEVQRSGGLLPPLSANKTAEIEEEFAEAKAERKRKYTSWRQNVEPVIGKLEVLEVLIKGVIEEAPHGSMTRKKARSELKALERVREEEANVALRDEAHTHIWRWCRGMYGRQLTLHEQQQQSGWQLYRSQLIMHEQ